MIALVARYHRRAHPKASHPEFSALDPEDQVAVRQLAAMLRIADGLDRAHANNVEDVRVRFEKQTACFDVIAKSEPQVDIWGADRKSKLFHRVFGWEPRLEWCQRDPE